jgi:hypothetical protein
MKQTVIPNFDDRTERGPYGNGASTRLDLIHVAWLFWAVRLLAELGCAGTASIIYLPSIDSGPFYLGYLAAATYLLQGIYLVQIRGRRPGQPPIRKIWWRILIAILGWPVHQIIVQLHKTMIWQRAQYFDEETGGRVMG